MEIAWLSPFCFFSISQVTTGNRTKHYVSYRRNEFVQMRFPKYALPKVKHNKHDMTADVASN